jgi:hypothetical protein
MRQVKAQTYTHYSSFLPVISKPHLESPSARETMACNYILAWVAVKKSETTAEGLHSLSAGKQQQKKFRVYNNRPMKSRSVD